MNKSIAIARLSLIKLLVTCLLFNLFQYGSAQNNLSAINAIPNDGNPFDGKGLYNRQRTQIMYWQSELLAKGFTAGSVIDTLCFEINSPNSILPYDLTIMYYYTASNFSYSVPFLQFTAPVIVAGGTVFSGQINLSVPGLFYVPPSGGTLKIPLTVPITWIGMNTPLVIQVCWDSNVDMITDSVTTLQKTGYNLLSRLRLHSSTLNACSLTDSTVGVAKNRSDWRPDLFCGTSPLAIHSIEKSKVFNIISLENKLQIRFDSPPTSNYDYTISDIAGRTILKGQTSKSKTGENTFEIGHHLTKGIYFIKLFNPGSQFGKLFSVL